MNTALPAQPSALCSLRAFALTATVALAPAISQAGVVFSFQDSGSGVTMTSSGSLDTRLLVASTATGWSGTGVGTFSAGTGSRDMIGSGIGGGINATYVFSAGTDVSAWDAGSFIGGSNFFGFSDSGTTAFATYALDSSGFISGVGINSGDVVASIWTPNNNWFAAGTSLAALALITGTYTITDAATGEFISIRIGTGGGTVPAPGTLGLVGLAVAGLVLARRHTA